MATGSLSPNPKNPNKHPPEQLRLYAKILRHQGWRKAITVSKQSGFIVTGEGAWRTAIQEGWASVPVDVQEFKSPADETAHLVADNRLPQMAEIDEKALSVLLEGFADGFDLEVAGLDETSVPDFEIKKIEPAPPPKFAWALIGIPIGQFGLVQAVLDELPESAVIKTTVSDNPKSEKLKS